MLAVNCLTSQKQQAPSRKAMGRGLLFCCSGADEIRTKVAVFLCLQHQAQLEPSICERKLADSAVLAAEVGNGMHTKTVALAPGYR